MDYYIVDAFSGELFRGNPTGVCVLEREIPAELMQKIAFENNLSETAFVLKRGDRYWLRWFTPGFEIDLCGHATLAAAHVIASYVEPGTRRIEFETKSGILTVEKNGSLYEMTLPSRPPKKIDCTDSIADILGFTPEELYSERDLYAVVKSEREVSAFSPDYGGLKRLDGWLGLVLTAPTVDGDFVSRYFCPSLQLEDPVTGSSHASLVPLWRGKTGRARFVARQLSQRGGVLHCAYAGEKVKVSGEATLYLKGTLMLP